jgi:hypothetical protein
LLSDSVLSRKGERRSAFDEIAWRDVLSLGTISADHVSIVESLDPSLYDGKRQMKAQALIQRMALFQRSASEGRCPHL